jgi:hypothetical protein
VATPPKFVNDLPTFDLYVNGGTELNSDATYYVDFNEDNTLVWASIGCTFTNIGDFAVG